MLPRLVHDCAHASEGQRVVKVDRDGAGVKVHRQTQHPLFVCLLGGYLDCFCLFVLLFVHMHFNYISNTMS